MTREEMRTRAIEIMANVGPLVPMQLTREGWIATMTAAFDALGVAGFKVVGSQLTDEMLHVSRCYFLDAISAYEAIVNKGDLTILPPEQPIHQE